MRLVWLDEIGAQTKMVEQKLLTVLGDSVDNARRAYGKTVEGKHRWMMFTTAVTVPRLSAHGGASRRMAVLPTLGIDLEAEGLKLPDESIDQELLDAVVTLAALRAPAVYAAGYRAPHGDEAAKAEAVAAMDPVSDWLGDLELPPKTGCRSPRSTRMRPRVFPELSLTELGTKVSAHPETGAPQARPRQRGLRLSEVGLGPPGNPVAAPAGLRGPFGLRPAGWVSGRPRWDFLRLPVGSPGYRCGEPGALSAPGPWVPGFPGVLGLWGSSASPLSPRCSSRRWYWTTNLRVGASRLF